MSLYVCVCVRVCVCACTDNHVNGALVSLRRTRPANRHTARGHRGQGHAPARGQGPTQGRRRAREPEVETRVRARAQTAARDAAPTEVRRGARMRFAWGRTANQKRRILKTKSE